MKHKRLLILSTCLVFAMVCFVALRELFTVKDVNVIYSVTTEGVTEEVYNLVEKYKGRNIFTVDLAEIKQEITANNYLKVLSVEKKYPNEILINLIERSERYYYVANDAVYYFDDEYFIVRMADSKPEGETYLTEWAFVEIMNGNALPVECSLMDYFVFPEDFINDVQLVTKTTAGIASSITKIIFVSTGEAGEHRISLQMREGVVIEIRKAGASLEEKLLSGVAFYNNLEEGKKIEGLIYVQIDDKSGKVASYYQKPHVN